MDDEVELQHARIVRLQPGDVVAFTVPEGTAINQHQAATIKDRLKKLFPNNECIVMSGGELTVMRSEEARHG